MSTTTTVSRDDTAVSPWWPSTWTRGTRILALLFALGMVIKVALYFRVVQAPWAGDEVAYIDQGKTLSNLVRDLVTFGSPDHDELRRTLVGSGWFMPGSGILLTPVFLLFPSADEVVVRAYLGLVTALLLWWAARRVQRLLGDWPAIAIVGFTALMPIWGMFSMGAWGDLPAGLVGAVVVAEAIRILIDAIEGRAPSWRTGVWIGFLAAATLYLRSSSQVMLAGVFVTVLAGLVIVLRGRVRLRAIGSLALAGVMFVGLLLPWTLYASHVFGSTVTTTTSTANVLAQTFGDREHDCYDDCDPGSTIWFSPLRYAREVSRATGVSEVEVLKEISAYARKDVTPTSYGYDVVQNFGRYTMQPAGYEHLLHEPPRTKTGPVSILLAVWGSIVYYPMLAAAVAAAFLVLRRPIRAQVTSIVLTVALAGLMAQPFVHEGSPRYWTSFAPLLAMSAVLVVAAWKARRGDAAGAAALWGADDVVVASPVPVRRLLWWIQALGAAAIAAIIVVIAALALLA